MALPGLIRRVSTLLLVLPAVATANPRQSVVLDEGSFRVSTGGREVGMETFVIRQNGSGPTSTISATGRLVLEDADGTQRSTTQLQTTGALRPTDYQLQVDGDSPFRVVGQLRSNRFTAQFSSPTGERMREYLAGEGTVLVDEDMAHHYYFLIQRAAGQTTQVPLIVPRADRQITAQVAPAGRSAIQIDGRSVTADRYAVRIAGEPDRTVWVDDRGLVLRVEVPARGYTADRTSLPR